MTDVRVPVADIKSAVEGDLVAFARMLEQPALVNRLNRAELPPLVLNAHAVSRVLRAFQRHAVAPSLVQQWASFIRRGFIAPAGKDPV